MPAPKGAEPPARIRIHYPEPTVDGGRYPPSAASATRSRSPPTSSATATRSCAPSSATGRRARGAGSRRRCTRSTRTSTACAGTASSRSRRAGRWECTIEAWTDQFATWRDELQRKVAAGQDDLAGELSEGVVLLEDAADRAESGEDRATIERALDALEDAARRPQTWRWRRTCSRRSSAPPSATARRGSRRRAIEVDRVRARFASWYELFPRSWGGLKAVEEQIPAIADLGFDVLYVPPIHPIGGKNRKGRNNTLVAGPDDPGSPYAIGGGRGRPRRRAPRARHARRRPRAVRDRAPSTAWTCASTSRSTRRPTTRG